VAPLQLAIYGDGTRFRNITQRLFAWQTAILASSSTVRMATNKPEQSWRNRRTGRAFDLVRGLPLVILEALPRVCR